MFTSGSRFVYIMREPLPLAPLGAGELAEVDAPLVLLLPAPELEGKSGAGRGIVTKKYTKKKMRVASMVL